MTVLISLTLALLCLAAASIWAICSWLRDTGPKITDVDIVNNALGRISYQYKDYGTTPDVPFIREAAKDLALIEEIRINQEQCNHQFIVPANDFREAHCSICGKLNPWPEIAMHPTWPPESRN